MSDVEMPWAEFQNLAIADNVSFPAYKPRTSKQRQQVLKVFKSHAKSELEPAQVVRYLGSGGQSHVFEISENNQRICCCKWFNSNRTSNVDRFHRERVALQSLGEVDGVPKYHKHNVDKRLLFMDIMPGYCLDDLHGWERDGKVNFTEDQKFDIFNQLLNIIEKCHEVGIFHRDIKPNNILVHDSNGKLSVSLIDFGLCFIESVEIQDELDKDTALSEMFYNCLLQLPEFENCNVKRSAVSDITLVVAVYLYLLNKEAKFMNYHFQHPRRFIQGPFFCQTPALGVLFEKQFQEKIELRYQCCNEIRDLFRQPIPVVMKMLRTIQSSRSVIPAFSHVKTFIKIDIYGNTSKNASATSEHPSIPGAYCIKFGQNKKDQHIFTLQNGCAICSTCDRYYFYTDTEVSRDPIKC